MTALRTLVLAGLGAASLSSTDAQAAVLVVQCTAGPFLTIQAAVNAAVPGDTVAVMPCTTGPYAPFVINGAQRLHVVAADPQYPDTNGALDVGALNNPMLFLARVVVDGAAAPNQSCVTIVGSADVTIHNLNLRNCAVHGVDVQSSFLVTLQSNRIWRSALEGVLVSPGSERFTAIGNLIAYSGLNGIVLLDTRDAMISDNQIGVNGANGIFLPTPLDFHAQLLNNEIRLNVGAGIEVNGFETRIERNDVYGNNTGGGALADLVIGPIATSPDVIGNDTVTYSLIDLSGTADVFGNR